MLLYLSHTKGCFVDLCYINFLFGLQKCCIICSPNIRNAYSSLLQELRSTSALFVCEWKCTHVNQDCLPKSLSYGKELRTPSNVNLQIYILICWFC